MKTQLRFLLILAISLVTFNSCSEDDNDNNAPTDGEITGIWNMVELEYSGSSVADFQGQNITTTYQGIGNNIDATMTMTEDPNNAVFEGSYEVDLSFNFAGQTQSQIFPVDDVESESTWTRSGNIMTFEGDFVTVQGTDLGDVETQDYTIEELTDNTLILTSAITQVVNNQGINSTVTIDIFIRFTR